MAARYRIGSFMIVLLAGVTAGGQGQPLTPAAPARRPDSARIVEAARQAQRDLERTRRRHLPYGYSGSGPCDIRLGSYCYWLYTDAPKPARPDPPDVIEAREELLALLDSAVRWDGDGWSRSQQVRYLVEADRFAAAERAAAACAPGPNGWCDALAGYVAHVAGDFAAAERRFASALARMPPERRCAWEDLSELLSGTLRSRYRDLDCEARRTLQARVLWLADPLWSVPGNELWTEHLARHVYATLRDTSHGVEGARWSRSRYRGVVRYGRPVWWERDASRRSAGRGVDNIITHHSPNGRYYFPRVDDPEQFARISEDDWELKWRRAPATHPPGHDAAHLEQLDYELTRWPMGDSTGLVALVAVDDDSLAPDHTVRVTLFGSRGPGETRARSADAPHRRAALDLVLPATPHLISLEALAPEPNRAGRVRFGVALPDTGALAVSALIAVTGADSLPRHRREAVSRLDPGSAWRAGEEVHLYWEVFSRGGAPVPMDITLRLRRTGRSFFRRLAEITPFASQDTPIALAWRELVQPEDELYRWGVSVTLPENVREGRYTFTLELRGPDGAHFEREREIRIKR